MEKIVLTIKDDNKLEFLMELLKQFKYIEIDQLEKEPNSEKEPAKYDLFKSAGIWKNRDISAEQIREKAWNREM